MSTDCLCEYHGRASRDILRVWSGWASQWTDGADTYQWTSRPRAPGARSRTPGVMSRCCWDRTRTRPTGVYTPLDRTTRTALPACTGLDPQPLARDPTGAGGVAWANQGWIGLKAETTAEPSRNGPGPRFGGIGKYRYIRSLPMSRWDLMPFHDRPFKGSETGEPESTSLMRFPTHVTMNTSDTYARLCVSEYSCLNRLCTPEALPGVLRTGPNSTSFPEQLPRLEKGGETTIHSQSTESLQMDQDTTP